MWNAGSGRENHFKFYQVYTSTATAKLCKYILSDLMCALSVLRVVFTFNISNTKKEGDFDSRIYKQITLHVQLFPLSALICMIFFKNLFFLLR